MLTIGELAEYAGVSVRTVRHYHQVGLLPEPARDELGHRRYDAESLILLRRICTLAEAGVPLRLVGDILATEPAARDGLLAEVDRDLRRRIADLRETRRRLDRLRTDEDAELPPGLTALLGRLREMGLSEEQIEVDRETWHLSHLLYPDVTEQWLAQQSALFDDAEYRALYVEAAEALHWDVDDPRLVDLADRNAAWTRRNLDAFAAYMGAWNADPRASAILEGFARARYDSPSYRRFRRLIEERLSDLLR